MKPRNRHFTNRKPYKDMRPQIHETTAAVAQEIKQQGSDEQREQQNLFLFKFFKWNRNKQLLNEGCKC